MKLNKKIAVAAAVGALGMAAVPAMALENEFSGIYNLGFFMSNVENGGTNVINPTTMRNANKTMNYFEQRARVKYTAKASDDLKLVTHFELDSKFGGSGATATAKNTGDSGQLDADNVMIETKNVYLDFNLGKNVNVKTGIQTVSDKFKGILYSVADMAGVNVTTKMGALDLNTAYFRVGQPLLTFGTGNTNGVAGWNNFDVVVLDAQYNVNKNAKVGAAYYLVSDNTTGAQAAAGTTTNYAVTVHTMGVYGSAKVGAATLSGFAAAQSGYEVLQSALGTRLSKSGYAANVAGRIPVGPGTIKAAYLFTSGDDRRDNIDTSWYSLQHNGWTGTNNGASSSGSLSQYNESGMLLLNRNLTTNATSTSSAFISNMGDIRGTGNSIISVGYDATITPKMFASANAGMAFASKNQSGGVNGSNLKATEVNAEVGYKLYPNLTASVQAAYAFLGGYYNGNVSATTGKNAENPYTGRIMLKYAF